MIVWRISLLSRGSLTFPELTFIILALPEKSLDVGTMDKTSIDTLPMIGDVNLFLASSVDETELEGEVEIMIAGDISLNLCSPNSDKLTEPAYRRRGLARAALSAFLRYATSHEICFVSHEQTQETIRAPINPSRLLVRIGQSNTPSIALFSKLGFTITKEANVFGEVEMRFTSGDEEKWWGQQSTEIVYPE
jgi:GNAT superfamily N-acetyltransferase